MHWVEIADGLDVKARITHFIAWSALSIWGAAWLAGAPGCTTAEVAPRAPLPALPPPYVQVPHPAGYTTGDVRAIFATAGSPKVEDLKDCDADFKKLKTSTQSLEELSAGARELVRRDPVKYHWCFYGRILQLEDSLKNESYLDEKQKAVLDTYGSLTPIGRAFMQEFHDSRYLRWGVKHYRQISEWVFYRKVEMTPQATSDLVEAANPFGLVREPGQTSPVLEKYGIVKPEPLPEPPAAPVATAPVVPTAPALPPPATPEPVATEAAVPAPSATPIAVPSAAPAVVEEVPPPAPAEQIQRAGTEKVDVPPPPVEAIQDVIPPPAEPIVPAAPPAPAARMPSAVPAVKRVAAPATPPPPKVETPPPAEPVAEAEPPVGEGTAEAILDGNSVTPTDSR